MQMQYFLEPAVLLLEKFQKRFQLVCDLTLRQCLIDELLCFKFFSVFINFFCFSSHFHCFIFIHQFIHMNHHQCLGQCYCMKATR